MCGYGEDTDILGIDKRSERKFSIQAKPLFLLAMTPLLCGHITHINRTRMVITRLLSYSVVGPSLTLTCNFGVLASGRGAEVFTGRLFVEKVVVEGRVSQLWNTVSDADGSR